MHEGCTTQKIAKSKGVSGSFRIMREKCCGMNYAEALKACGLSDEDANTVVEGSDILGRLANLPRYKSIKLNRRSRDLWEVTIYENIDPPSFRLFKSEKAAIAWCAGLHTEIIDLLPWHYRARVLAVKNIFSTGLMS